MDSPSRPEWLSQRAMLFIAGFSFSLMHLLVDEQPPDFFVGLFQRAVFCAIAFVVTSIVLAIWMRIVVESSKRFAWLLLKLKPLYAGFLLGACGCFVARYWATSRPSPQLGCSCVMAASYVVASLLVLPDERVACDTTKLQCTNSDKIGE